MEFRKLVLTIRAQEDGSRLYVVDDPSTDERWECPTIKCLINFLQDELIVDAE